MDHFFFKTSKKSFLLFLIFFGLHSNLGAQAPEPPIPVEILIGHQDIYYQMVVKRAFDAKRKINFFGLATYTANYEDRVRDNRVITIAQLSYTFAKGFGIMAGTDMNSFAGFSPIVGPQHNFANRKILAVTVLSYFLNEENDLKLFGLYEFKPPINEKWSVYSRFQFVYNRSLKESVHNKSYIYLRAGVKRKALIFGLGANIDWSGPNRAYDDNYGGFVRWEFR